MASFTGTYKDELIATANVDTGVESTARRAAAAYITGDFFTESRGARRLAYCFYYTQAIAAPGKGILAADESTGTIGKRFAYNRRVRP